MYIIILFLTSCGNNNYNEFGGLVWGTGYHIVYKGDKRLADSAIVVMKHIDDELSMFNKQSTVSKINDCITDSCTEAFKEIFVLSAKINNLSCGAFDPTIGPLTDLWGFGRSKIENMYSPTDQQIDSVLCLVGFERCSLQEDKIIKKHPETVFDFSSIAKGYGVDLIGRMFRRNGCTNFLIEIGGEILSSGVNAKGREWRVQIDAPTSGISGHESMYVIALRDAAIATSGNYRNFRETSDGRVGHTIDPRTGRPVVGNTLSASVIAPDCATADALATACMVMRSDSAVAMVERLKGVEVLLAVDAGDTISIVRSSGFPEQ